MHIASRYTLLVTLVLGGILPAYADKPKARSEDAAARPLIETSYLIAPERIGDFMLEGSSYDDKNKHAGAGFRYALKDHQETRIDVFVYPAGRASQASAIASGMVEFRADIEHAQTAGRIRDLQFLAEEDFPLDVPEPAKSADASDTKLDAVLKKAIASTLTIGKRIRMHNTMVNGGFPIASNGYLFYRQLFFFKVRASAARDRIDQAEFDTLTDRAARELVQAIEVANIGGCSSNVIEVPKDADSETFAQILVVRSAQIKDENCFGNAEEAKLKEKSGSASVVRIDFTANDWKAQ